MGGSDGYGGLWARCMSAKRSGPEAEEAPGEVGDGLQAVVDVQLRGHEDEAVFGVL